MQVWAALSYLAPAPAQLFCTSRDARGAAAMQAAAGAETLLCQQPVTALGPSPANPCSRASHWKGASKLFCVRVWVWACARTRACTRLLSTRGPHEIFDGSQRVQRASSLGPGCRRLPPTLAGVAEAATRRHAGACWRATQRLASARTAAAMQGAHPRRTQSSWVSTSLHADSASGHADARGHGSTEEPPKCSVNHAEA